MNLALLLLTGVTIGISGAMIPGPLTLFTISEVLKSNRFAGLKIISGHIAIEFIFIWLILSGLHEFLNSEGFLSAVSIIGGSALILMGIILIVNASKMEILHKGTGSRFNKNLFIGGIFLSVISPGFLIWWATIGISTVIRALLFGIAGVIALTLGHWLADIGWYWSLSYAVDKGKKYLTPSLYQNVIRLLSALLIILGIRFLLIG